MKIFKKRTINDDDHRMLKQIFNRSCLLFTSFNMVNYQGLGYAYALIPAIDRYYKDNETKRIEALKNSTSFFNCTYETAPFVIGIDAAMEKENAENENFDINSINSIKASLMGPMSAIGDSVFWGVVRTVAAAVGISLGLTGNILGPILFIVLYTIISWYSRWKLLNVGFTGGSKI